MKKSNFEVNSYSARCEAFFDTSHPWSNGENARLPDLKRRTVTWAHHPYRYWIEQDGVEHKNILRQKNVIHRMFEVSLISAANTLDGLRELEKWYIVPSTDNSEHIAHFSHIVEEPELENISGEMKENFTFVIENKLYQPNSEDLLRLDLILDNGRLDGYEPYNFSRTK